MAKKINHRGHGGHRELLFSLCPLCSLWFSKTQFPEDNKKSPEQHRSAPLPDHAHIDPYPALLHIIADPLHCVLNHPAVRGDQASLPA